jgi:ERF superfamily
MRTSEQIHELVSALAKARTDFEPIVRSKTVTVKSDRGSYQFSYAPLEDILAAVADALSAHGLVLVSGIEQAGDGSVVLSTRLMHASGQWLESIVHVGRHGKMQEMGSSLTYARRYAITGLLGISAADDDDANAADGNAIVAQASRQGQRTDQELRANLPEVPGAPPARPTAEEIDALVATAAACHEPKDVLATQLRRIMGLDGQARITKKFLRESMTVTQFEVARAYYERLLKQQIEEDIPDHEPPFPHRDPGAPEGTNRVMILLTPVRM